jgi:hypothetical protein
MLRGALLLLLAFAIDLIQMGITWGLLGVGTFSGTSGGAIAGCLLGQQVAGGFGCSALGFIGGFVGTAANPYLAAYTIPMMVGLGFVINFCISATAGSMLIVFLGLNRMLYPKYLIPGAITELIPGIDSLPFWTLLVILSIMESMGEKKGGSVLNTAAKVVSAVASPEGAAMKTLAGATFAAGLVRGARGASSEPAQTSSQTQSRPSLKSIDGIRKAGAAALVALFFFTGSMAHAQTVNPDPVQYVVAPEAPGPNQLVSIEAQGIGSFLGNAMITWSQDGVVVKKGLGERQYSFTTGAVGKATTVRVSIDSSTEGSFTKTFTFNPSVIALLWEANTTVPPFYRGKPLYSAGSPLKVVALPTIYSGSSRIAASALSYQWSRNDEPVPEVSGMGRSTFSFDGDQLQPAEQIGVDVYYGNVKVGHSDVSIPVVDPAILIFQRDPLRGVIYDHALPDTVSLVNKELTIQAEPFFFSSASKKSGALVYNWQIDNQDTTGPDTSKGILTLRQTGSGVGEAQLSVNLQNFGDSTFIQNANTNLRIVFGDQSGSTVSNFLGL